ncbi:MAG: hypothetical protein M1834_005499 [Cirrosporium novae-zelandiae]|nr:MAG: hypothetical protein M1834_005499 [Cirrosporium novae-zelandiae]
MERHKRVIAAIAANVRTFYNRKEPFRIFHGSTNSTRDSMFKRTRMVDTSLLSNVLKIDTQARTALVEPNVPMDRLVEATMKHGLVPPVVMEFPGITVGGGYSGTSGESSSFKYGFFNRTINSIEMVLANGEVVTASNDKNADLFHGAAGAVGSLGITTLVELQLKKAKPFIKATFHPISGGMAEAIPKLKEVMADPEIDYVDGILFSKSKGAIITGQSIDTIEDCSKVQTFSGPSDPWFYLHVQNAVSRSTSPITETIPLAEYLFRYDRGGFWVGRSAFKYFMFPFNNLTRWFLDDFLHTRMLYKALNASGFSKQYIVQDLALPYSTAEEFVDFTDATFGIYPLWLCPLKQSPLPTMHPHSSEMEADGKTQKGMLNIGLWGFGPSGRTTALAANRRLEHKLRELGGMKWLYAHTYYSENEFWEMFDRRWYDNLRAKYHATSLPSVYDKVKVDAESEEKAFREPRLLRYLSFWPIGGVWGIRKAIESKEYLKARNATWKWTRKRIL